MNARCSPASTRFNGINIQSARATAVYDNRLLIRVWEAAIKAFTFQPCSGTSVTVVSPSRDRSESGRLVPVSVNQIYCAFAPPQNPAIDCRTTVETSVNYNSLQRVKRSKRASALRGCEARFVSICNELYWCWSQHLSWVLCMISVHSPVVTVAAHATGCGTRRGLEPR